jgi:hypothetical protein
MYQKNYFIFCIEGFSFMVNCSALMHGRRNGHGKNHLLSKKQIDGAHHHN